MKYTLITGGSQGLGESLVLEFAKHNHNIIIGYNTNKEKAEKLNEYIKTNYKVESIIKKIDITNEEDIKDIFNNGVTLWHNPNTFLDYSQSNNIV